MANIYSGPSRILTEELIGANLFSPIAATSFPTDVSGNPIPLIKPGTTALDNNNRKWVFVFVNSALATNQAGSLAIATTSTIGREWAITNTTGGSYTCGANNPTVGTNLTAAIATNNYVWVTAPTNVA
jgi:hypothetical protein